MSAKILTPGGRLELNEIPRENSRMSNVYLSQIYDVDEDEKRVSVAMPFKEGRLIVLSVGMHFDAYFYAKNGLYHSRVVVVERYKSNNLYGLVMELKTPLKKVQRRQYFRYQTLKPLRYVTVDDDMAELIRKLGTLPEGHDNIQLSEGSTLDISGGGMRFAGQHLEVGSKVYVEFDYFMMGRPRMLKATAVVISSEAPLNRHDIYHNRIRFEYVNPDERESLIRYIFEEERKDRQNERRG
ncbi:MAG: flagellar brake protein [Lachnospiraceae bacterium]